jgi:hypothetical protein
MAEPLMVAVIVMMNHVHFCGTNQFSWL